MMATFKKKRPDQAFQSTHITFQRQEFGKTAPVRQLFQATWFQLLQVASLASVTTGRPEVKFLVPFWPEYNMP